MGGGGRGGGRPAGGRQSNVPPGGISFFEQGDKEVPGFTALYDPQQDPTPLYIAYEGEEQQQPPGGTPPLGPGQARSPRSDVRTVPLPELGAVVISAGNKEDYALALEIVKLLQDRAKQTEIQFVIFPLDTADATNVVNILSQVFTRFQTGASGSNFSRPAGGNPLANFLQQQTQLSSVFLYPLVRQNAIMIGAPANVVATVKAEIKKLDIATAPASQARPFALERASASQVATQIQDWYSVRYNDTNQVRVTYDNSTNTIFVQASPDDMAEIERLIKWVDNKGSAVINEIRIVQLKRSLSDELAQTLLEALQQIVVAPAANGGVLTPLSGGPGGGLGAPANALRPTTPTTPAFGAPGTGGGGTGSVGTTGSSVGPTKTVTLKFQTGKPGSEPVYGGMLDDVHITSEPRSNQLLLIAPEKTMDLLMKLIADLDVVAAARAEINVFPLKRADAAQVSQILQQMFLGTTTTGAGGAGAAPGTTGTGGRVFLTNDQGSPGDGSVLIQLRVAVDNRSNSLIVAGSRNDLEVVSSIVARLDDDVGKDRVHLVFKLRHQAAADVATAVQTFFTNALSPLSDATYTSPYQYLLREVVAVPESVSNTVLVDASPKYADEIKRIIDQIDETPPQVLVQVTIAQVTLNNDLEFGIEVGGQSPVLFDRSVFSPAGTAVNNALANPGFGFATSTNAGVLPSQTLTQPNLIGVQGVNALGVGTSSVNPNATGGGFVFSASSASVNVLIRALQVQNRIDVISSPLLVTTDNQAARFNAGEDVPYLANTTLSPTGFVTPSLERRTVGVILTVTPRISPDGRVIMRVTPEVSSVDPTPFTIIGASATSGATTSTGFFVQNVDTTVGAYDGETIILGGMITKSEVKNESKVPILGDIPVLGALWRYRTDATKRQELLIIMTPHIIRTQADAARVREELRTKFHFNNCDLNRIHSGFWDVTSALQSGDPGLSPGQRLFMAPLPTNEQPASPPGTPLPTPRIAPTAPMPQAPAPMPQPTSTTFIGSVTQSNGIQYGSTAPSGGPVLMAPQNSPANSNTGKESQSWTITHPQ